MPDRRPPRLAAPERETVQALLQYQRESVVRKVEGLDDAQAGASPVASGTSLRWLVAHLAEAESTWLEARFVGTPRPPQAAPETLADAVAAYRATWARSDAVVAAASLEDTCRGEDAAVVNLRWILAHLLEETARHAGHADVLRELLDGEVGR